MKIRTRSVRVIALGAAMLLTAACSSSAKSDNPTVTSGSSTPTPASSTAATTVGGTPTKSTATATTTKSTPTTPAPVAPVGPAGGAVPAGFHPASVTFSDPNHAWVLGTAPCATAPCTSIVRTRDGGASWQGIPAPRAGLTFTAAITENSVYSIRFADQLNGWVWGSQLWATHNGGASWHQVILPAAAGTISGLEASGKVVYASTTGCPSNASSVGCTGTSTVFAASTAGDTWTSIAAIRVGNFPPGGLLLDGFNWWVPARAGVYHGQGRAAPVAFANPCAGVTTLGVDAGFAALAVADENHLDALCTGNGAAGSTGAQLVGTNNGAVHWANAGRPTRVPSAIAGLADNTAGVLMLAAYSGGSELLRTTNDGASWTTPLTAPQGGGIAWRDLGFTTSTQGVAVLWGTSLYLTHNAGASWAAVTF